MPRRRSLLFLLLAVLAPLLGLGALLLLNLPAAIAEVPGICIDDLRLDVDHDEAIVMISWMAVPGATFYDVHRVIDGGDNEHLATIPAGTTFYIDDPAPEAVLDYRVAYDGHPSLDCVAVNVHIGGNPPDSDVPICVGGLTGAALPDGGIRLMWPAIPGATSYDVLRATVDGPLVPHAFVPFDQTSYTDPDAERGVPFRYTVNANGLVGPDRRCEEVTIIAIPEFPSVMWGVGVGAISALVLVAMRKRRA